MEKMFLLVASVSLANLNGAAEKLTIAPAHGFSDYTKSIASEGTSERPFLVGFAGGDFNKDGRLDFVVQTGSLSANFLPFGAQVFLQQTNGAFAKATEYILPNTGVTWDFV